MSASIQPRGAHLWTLLGRAWLRGVFPAIVAALAVALVFSWPDRLVLSALASVSWSTALVTILVSWRRGVFAFFLWILVEDFFRKWLDNHLVLYAAKDVLLLALLLSFTWWLLKQRRPIRLRSLLLPLSLLITVGVISATRSVVIDWRMPLVGLRMWFAYVPLLWVGYEAFRSDRDLWRFLIVSLSGAVVIAAVGLAQVAFGTELGNPAETPPFLSAGSIRAIEGEGFWWKRPTSVFVDAGRFGNYVLLGVALAWGALASAILKDVRATRVARPLLMLAAMLVSLSALLSGQRAAILLAPLIIAGSLLSIGRASRLIRRQGAWVLLLFTLTAGSLAAILAVSPTVSGLARFYYESFVPGGLLEAWGWRFQIYAHENTVALRQSGLWGHGVGTASLGQQYLFGVRDWYVPGGGSTAPVEGGFAAVVWELGLIGLLLWSSVLVTLSWMLLRTVRRVRAADHWLTPFAGAVVAWALSVLFLWFFISTSAYQNYVTAAYLWFLSGVVLAGPWDRHPARPPVTSTGPRTS